MSTGAEFDPLATATPIRVPENAQPVSKAAPEDYYDAYQCATCGRLILKPEMIESLKQGGLPCGHGKVRPTNVEWYHWVLPRVWMFAKDRINEKLPDWIDALLARVGGRVGVVIKNKTVGALKGLWNRIRGKK